MKCEKDARFALSEHVFRTHYGGGEVFSDTQIQGYTPQMLKRAYSFDENALGDGIRLAVIAAFDNVGIEENMRVFCEEFSLPVPKMTLHYPYGRTEATSREWLVESSLDTQWAHVFAPHAEIEVVFANDSSVDSLLSSARYASQELSAHIVSMSFGADESARDAALAEFMSESRCIFVASSGDVGGQVSFPSSSTDCISVGGTKLVLGENTRRISETAWQNGGGGSSDVFGISAFQGRFFNIYGETHGMRATPDVSMMANFNPGVPSYVSALGGWTTVGGTSLSCACFAGICACIKEKNPQLETSGDMLSYLYMKAGTVGYELPQYNFNDITFGRSGMFLAETGWDFCTGLGSPVIKRLLL